MHTNLLTAFGMRLTNLIPSFLLVVTAITATAQTPAWLDEDWRHSNFPASSYFCGFALVTPDLDPKPAQAAHTEALRLLAESVFSNVNVSTVSSMGSTVSNDRCEEFDTFRRDISVNSAVGLTGITLDTYTDPATGAAYEFARVEKERLRTYYDALVASALADAHSTLDIAAQAADTADKSVLKAHADGVAGSLATARSHRGILLAVSPSDAAAHDLGLRGAEERLAALEAVIAGGITVYVQGAGDPHSTLVVSKLKASLAASGCTFADTEDEADYLLSLSAATELQSVFDDVYHVNAMVDIALTNRRKGLVVYQDAVTHKGSALAEKQAGTKALNGSVAKIEKLISPHIK